MSNTWISKLIYLGYILLNHIMYKTSISLLN